MISVGSTRTPRFATTWYALAMSMRRISPAPMPNERPSRLRSQSRSIPIWWIVSMIASTPTVRVTCSAGRLSDSRSACRMVSGPCCCDLPSPCGASCGWYGLPLPSGSSHSMSYKRVDAVMPARRKPVR